MNCAYSELAFDRKGKVMCVTNSNFFSLTEHGPMDDEAVVPGAAANDQTEHKQCKLLFDVHLTIF